jgi:hypothetical protein
MIFRVLVVVANGVKSDDLGVLGVAICNLCHTPLSKMTAKDIL